MNVIVHFSIELIKRAFSAYRILCSHMGIDSTFQARVVQQFLYRSNIILGLKQMGHKRVVLQRMDCNPLSNTRR